MIIQHEILNIQYQQNSLLTKKVSIHIEGINWSPIGLLYCLAYSPVVPPLLDPAEGLSVPVPRLAAMHDTTDRPQRLNNRNNK